ncbi:MULTISPECIES: M28 family peptidase [unclassified Sphingomonas]|uniref:M28 family peptidase n=1 Tax=unclassified Sphingomonas TaxID=196159 RepID=UPI0025E2A88E|nr:MULTISPECIES: M28 family peptidase [unclassified Sphingomonas]
MRAAVLALAAVLLIGTASPARRVGIASSASRLRADVTWLSADARMGRDPAGSGYAQASAYVARAFAGAGLRPAGDSGFFQPVPLVRYGVGGPVTATFMVPGRPVVTLRPGVDIYPEADPTAPGQRVSAPVVFVGDGIVDAKGRDDYRGLDVRGRIVAVRFGGAGIDDPVDRAILWDIARKRRSARARGAIGMIGIHVADPGNASFATAGKVAAYPALGWRTNDGESGGGPAATPMLATISEAGAAVLFGEDWQRRRGATLAGAVLTIASETRIEPAPSRNVVAFLPGRDPHLAGETLVLSAHLDHIGVSAGPGDRINNGALDNAIGVAVMLEAARNLARAHPRRSVLFVALTGEEAGLLGSDYFAAHPPRGVGRIVADINVDMPILTYRFADMIAFGSDLSTLGEPVRAVLEHAGVALSPDPEPGQAFFARSDQMSFARRGVAAVMLWPGRQGAGAAATDAFLEHRYHRPSDDIAQPIAWAQAARYGAIITTIARRVGDAPQRPRFLDPRRFAPAG